MAWREASTLIVAARSANISLKSSIGPVLKEAISSVDQKPPGDERQVNKQADYGVLMAKRSNRSSFMASTYVFPGGVVDPSDYSPKWWSLFDKLGYSKDGLIKTMSSRVCEPRPPMITHPISKNHVDGLIPDIALRITAIREAFEETGLLVLVDPPSKFEKNSKIPSSSSLDNLNPELLDWRSRIRENGEAFIEMCHHYQKIPNIWSLYEWWNWATPKLEGPKRFDTMFYIHCADHQSKVILDNTEVTKFKWAAPKELLREFVEKKIILPPPQVFELGRLANFDNLTDLEQFSANREKQSVEKWLPVLIKHANGSRVYLPGDILYPDDPETDLEPIDTQDENELMKSGVTINRLKRVDATFTYLSNHKDYGHLKPIFTP